MEKDHAGVINYEIDLTKHQECNNKDIGCIAYLKIVYGNSSIPVGEKGSIIALKVELGDNDKIPMEKGQFREFTLTKYFPSDYVNSTIDASKNNL